MGAVRSRKKKGWIDYRKNSIGQSAGRAGKKVPWGVQCPERLADQVGLNLKYGLEVFNTAQRNHRSRFLCHFPQVKAAEKGKRKVSTAARPSSGHSQAYWSSKRGNHHAAEGVNKLAPREI